MTKLKVLLIMLLAFASVSTAQLVHDEVKVKVEPAVTCPSSWTASTESITIPTRYTVRVPASIGGRSFLVSLGFVNAVWPSSANKASAVARAP